MRGLTIIVAARDPARLRTALTLAATQAALGARARLFLDGEAVGLLGIEPVDDDTRHRAAGLPSRQELCDTCFDLGVGITVCQSGLALAGLDLATLDPRLQAGGLTTVLATLADDRLLAM